MWSTAPQRGFAGFEGGNCAQDVLVLPRRREDRLSKGLGSITLHKFANAVSQDIQTLASSRADPDRLKFLQGGIWIRGQIQLIRDDEVRQPLDPIAEPQVFSIQG